MRDGLRLRFPPSPTRHRFVTRHCRKLQYEDPRRGEVAFCILPAASPRWRRWLYLSFSSAGYEIFRKNPAVARRLLSIDACAFSQAPAVGGMRIVRSRHGRVRVPGAETACGGGRFGANSGGGGGSTGDRKTFFDLDCDGLVYRIAQDFVSAGTLSPCGDAFGRGRRAAARRLWIVWERLGIFLDGSRTVGLKTFRVFGRECFCDKGRKEVRTGENCSVLK